MDRIDRIDELDLFTSSSSEDFPSDDDVPARRERIVQQRNDVFHELDDFEFKKRFRMPKHIFEHLEGLLENLPEPLDNRNHPVSKRNQILIALRFYATGSFEINLGDLFNLSQSTVSRVVTSVTSHIAALRPQYINMPDTEQEQRKTVLHFYDIAGVPGIIGTLDCTHIKIQSPGGENGEVFRNRKGWFSIHTQVVSDSKLRITDIVARWPGSVHDTTIFNDSTLRGRFENQEFLPYCLLGDAGYPCRVYLLTPLLNPQTPAQQRYNGAHITTRNVVERLFGVLKRRFPCLSLGLRIKLETVCEVIVTCAVLNNICIEAGDQLDDFAEDIPAINEAIGIFNYDFRNRNQNTSTRDTLIATVFA